MTSRTAGEGTAQVKQVYPLQSTSARTTLSVLKNTEGSQNTVLPEVIIIHTFAVCESHEYRDMATGTVMSS